MTINKESGEFMVMVELPTDTQKKIKQWLSTGYEITIISQLLMDKMIVTTLTRTKNV